MFKSLRPVLAPIALSLLALPGCDEASPSDLELRSVHVKTVYQTATPTVFKLDILPPDDAPGNDGPDGGGGPDFENVLRNAPAILAAAYQGSIESESFCPDACAEEDLEWSGEVTASAELGVESSEWVEGRGGEVLFGEAIVAGEVAMGCACE
ncbi:MAG: hypothetical protein ACRBN8_42920 [Nannocystales bacterium]